MILLAAIVAGIVTGWGFARWRGHTWQPPVFRAIWLVILGFLPQLTAFYLPFTRHLFSDETASACLIGSQAILLAFAITNHRLPGMIILAAGLGLNLIVILANGGFMPLSVDTAARLVDRSVLDILHIGERVSSSSKDVLLPDSHIVLPWLADRFVPPSFIPYRFAFSLGDVFVAVGAFWLLGDHHPANTPEDLGDM